jgi:uncharacterized protein (DUF305 family)
MGPAFNRIWASSIVSNLADGVMIAAVPLLAISFTDSPVLIAAIGAMVEAQGQEFDRLFLQGMIKHHEGAIVMAQDVAVSMNKEVADLSAAIISAQELEIAAMKELLLKR